MRTEVAAGSLCRACLSADLKEHPVSRKSGTVVQECGSCGLHAMRDRPSTEFFASWSDGDLGSYETWAAELRTDVVDQRHADAVALLRGMLVDVEQPSIFDVGAGDGAFLEVARHAGFRPFGNELWTGAIERARDVRGLSIEYGDLSDLPDVGKHDAVTLWCVLAHVPDEDALLRDVRSILKPGGLVLLQTPRYTSLDTAAFALHDITRGRMTRITDRRLAEHHMSLHTATSIRRVIERAGLEVVSVEARSRWGFTTSYYLETLDVPSRVLAPAARFFDRLIERGWFFRNVLDVCARLPEHPRTGST
jgi:2-polyprenyl-3-methyl-5-hydroxy-6-metoxy-1,4-benzoquinol methylase